jgi:hypothetical protein
MLKGIIIYFLLLICLLSKDGICVCVDSFCDSNAIACSVNMSFDDEDSTSDLWHFSSSGLEIYPDLGKSGNNKIVASFKATWLNVLLEQVSPPPRMA